MRYNREQLKAMGMDEKQINAIMATYDAAVSAQTAEDNAVATPLKVHDKAISYGGAAGVAYSRAVPDRALPVMDETEAMKVTSIADLHVYGQGKVVRFPDFAEGQPFVARVRRPSMLVLAKQGKIPNALMASANQLFAGGGSGMDADNPDMLSDIFDVCEVIATAALIEPSYEEIKQAGLELSDNQMMAIFSYTQNGIKALENFR